VLVLFKKSFVQCMKLVGVPWSLLASSGSVDRRGQRKADRCSMTSQMGLAVQSRSPSMK